MYKLETAKFVFRLMHNTLPQSFSDFYVKVSEISDRTRRSSGNRYRLYIPRYNTNTKDGSTVRYVVREASIFAKKYGTLVRYAFFVMVRYVGTVYALFVKVRVRYVGTLFEFKIPHFSHIAPAFCMQRQKTAKADAKCVN